MLLFPCCFSQALPPAPSSSSPFVLRAQALTLVPSSSFHSIPPTSPLYPQFSHTNSLVKPPLFSETLPVTFSFQPIGTYPFKIKPSEDLEAKPLISYMPWTKAELQATVKDFLKVIEDPHRFAEEFNIVIQTLQPGFSDLYQLVHILVNEGQAQHCMKTANWKNFERSLEL